MLKLWWLLIYLVYLLPILGYLLHVHHSPSKMRSHCWTEVTTWTISKVSQLSSLYPLRWEAGSEFPSVATLDISHLHSLSCLLHKMKISWMTSQKCTPFPSVSSSSKEVWLELKFSWRMALATSIGFWDQPLELVLEFLQSQHLSLALPQQSELM